MPLPLTVSCFSKIQIGFTFLVPAHLGSPGKGPLNGCVCVCVSSGDCACWAAYIFYQSMFVSREGEKIADVSCESPTFTVAWHPKRHLLAFACDDKDKYDRERDSGTVKLFGVTDSRDTS